MGHRFSAEENERYAQDGFLLRPAVFGPEEVERLRQAVEEMIAGVVARACRSGAGPEIRTADRKRMQFSSRAAIQWEWAEGSQQIRVLEPFTHLHPRLGALWEDPRLLESSADALGVQRVSPFTCKLNLKRPREGSRFAWHQDYPYWYVRTPEHARELVTAMIYLDDATAQNGALRFVVGSHRHGPLPRDLSEPTRFLTDPAAVDPAAARTVEAPAGSLLLFGPFVVHGSEPNLSDLQRRALLLSFQPEGRPRLQALPWQTERIVDLP